MQDAADPRKPVLCPIMHCGSATPSPSQSSVSLYAWGPCPVHQPFGREQGTGFWHLVLGHVSLHSEADPIKPVCWLPWAQNGSGMPSPSQSMVSTYETWPYADVHQPDGREQGTAAPHLVLGQVSLQPLADPRKPVLAPARLLSLQYGSAIPSPSQSFSSEYVAPCMHQPAGRAQGTVFWHTPLGHVSMQPVAEPRKPVCDVSPGPDSDGEAQYGSVTPSPSQSIVSMYMAP